MVSLRKVASEFPYFIVILLVISSAGAQWANPWITLPPPSSAAFDHVNVSATSNLLDAEENIAGSTTLAVLRFTQGGNESYDPILFGGCGSVLRLGPSNNGMMDIISLKEFDYESGDNNSYDCTFLISKPSTSIKTLKFNIKDLNDNRPFFDKYPSTSLNFSENAVGLLYDFSATDRDKGDVSSLIYSFVALGGDGSNFTMNPQTGEFSVTKMLDYEAGQFYLFNMIVTDRGGLTGSTQVALNVIDEKDSNPVWKLEVPFKNIFEQQPVGTAVFSVLARDGDVTVNDEMVYSIVDPRGSFSIEPTTGQVRIAKVIDRDVDDFDSYFDLNITATCKNYQSFKSVTYSTVFINDINDNLPTFDKPVYDFTNVDEDFVGRLSQMDILVSDPDLKDFGSYVMSIEGSAEVKSHLELSPSTGRNNGIFSLRIISTGLLDYEDNAKRNVTFTVVATEVSGTRSSSSLVNLYSRDINDNSPIFIKSEFTANITENLAIGSLVTTVQATDADISSGFGQPSIRYSIVENYDAARFFVINETTGEIRTSNNVDREISSSLLKYTVQAIDKNGNYDGRRSVANLVINIQDVNDDPPAFSPPSTITFPLKEDAVSGTELTQVSASDKDDNPNLTFSINWDNSKFYKNRATISNPDAEWKKSFVLKSVSRSWNKEFSRVISSVTASVRVGDSSLPPGNCNDCSNTPLDREKFDSVQLCLTITDSNTILNRNQDELYIVVDILDVNDNDPVFDVLDKEFTVVEGNATVVGTVFGSVRATDADVNNIVTYSLRPSSCDNVAVDENNGQLSTTGLVDRETSDLIECIVTATDSGIPVRSSSTKVKINVVDVNDNEPVLTVTPSQVSIYECSTKSPTKIGTKISKLTATDADIGAYGTVSFMLSQQNSEGVDEFAVDVYTGDMTVRNCELLDFDTKTSYSVVVEARDNYREGITLGSLSAFKRINITLVDVNDNAPTISSPGIPNECYASPLESLNMNDLVASIQGSDKDSNGPNKYMTFTLHEQTRLGSNPSEKCKELFRLETEENSIGNVFVNVPDMLDCTGNYDVVVQACDQGDSIEGVQCSRNTTYRICVLDVNNNYPQFVFPVSNNTVFEVPENSPVGSPLVYNGTNLQLTFKATDSDEGVNGQIIYTWSNDSVNDVFSLNKDSGVVTLNSELNRNVQSYYNLVVLATDKGVPSPLSSSLNLRINVRLSNKQLPYFESNTESLSFTENTIESKTFQSATDRDNNNLYPGESPYDVCYYVVCGNSEYFDVPDKAINKLGTKKTLDREKIPPIIPYVVIYTTNDCTNKPDVGSCSEIDTTKGQYLNVTVNILDVNDCDPEFSGSLSGGITQGDSSGKRVFPMTITDQDENDVVTCKIEEEFTVSPSSVGLANVNKPPFRIESDQWITLLFTVQPDMKGFFILNVTCEDKVKHSSRKAIKIYVVTQEDKVDIVFDNKKEEIEAKRSEIETIFTTTMGFTCNVEKVIGYDSGTAQTGNKTYNSALSHFIDETKEEAEPVLANVIIAKKDEPSITNELISLCRDEGLTLISVGPLPTETNTSEAIFKILFIVACVVLLILIVLVGFLFFSNSELKHRLAAFVRRPSFGSEGSKIENAGMAVPNSNVYAEGSSNPIYSLERSSTSNHDSSFDNMSQSSGDSILIGVENNPEFNSKKANGKSRYIEEDLPFTFQQNVTRRNPLANDSPPEPSHPPPPPPPLQRSIKRPAPPVPVLNLDDSDRSEEDDSDSNFSFGDVTMTAI